MKATKNGSGAPTPLPRSIHKIAVLLKGAFIL